MWPYNVIQEWLERNHRFGHARKPGGCTNHCASEKTKQSGIIVAACPTDGVHLSTSYNNHAVDLEGGTHFEQIMLNVRGMTCMGCQNALDRAIHAIPTARKVRSSMVTARAEFEVDTRCMPAEKAIVALEQATSYSYVRIFENEDHYLDVLVPDASSFCSQSPPPGVLGLRAIDETVARISFNPSKTGARHIVGKLFAEELTLAPLDLDPTVSAGRQGLCRQAIIMALAAMATLPILVFAWAPIKATASSHSISLALATVIQLGVVWLFYPSAFKSLIHSRLLGVDALIVLSTTTAYVFSVIIYAFEVAHRPIYNKDFFASSTLLVTIILVGRFISDLARQKSIQSVSIRSLQSQMTTIYTNVQRTETRDIDIRLLEHGDLFHVPANSRIATDGTVVFGGSEVDESMVTGEPLPVAKALDSKVIAGSLNKSGNMDVLVSRLPHENTISTIAKLVDEAELSKPHAQAVADRFAGYFVPAILALTVVVFVTQFVSALLGRHFDAGKAAVNAITYAIAALIVSCPCAIGLAVPMVLVIANGISARHGVVLKDPQMIEIARKVTHVVLDKTGTLTNDAMAVVIEKYFPIKEFELQQIKTVLFQLLANVKHPVSMGVANHLRLEQKSLESRTVKNIKSEPGKGVEGIYRDALLRAGNPHWLAVSNLPSVSAIRQTDPQLTIFCVTWKSRILAVFGLGNQLRPDALQVVQALQAQQIKVSIVSGDDELAVEAVASELGIDKANVQWRCSPPEKHEYIQRIQQDQPEAVVLFCGDGTNDAPALKIAHVGVHMASSSGTDVARAAAAIVLVRPELTGLLVAIDISKASYYRIIGNFLWCALYNVVALSMAAGAWVEIRIPPEYAALGELASVLPVIVVAWSLTWRSSYGRSKGTSKRSVTPSV